MNERSNESPSSPIEKENMEPFHFGNKGMRMLMMPLEVQRLINENSSSSSGSSPGPNSSSAGISSPPSSASPRGPLKTIIRYGTDPNLSSPPLRIQHSIHQITNVPPPFSSKKTRTPSGPRLNPFETAREDLHLPVIMSPSIFATVQSPSQVNDDHFWSLEDRAALFFSSSHFGGLSLEQEERKLDPETEIKTQEALNRYFDHHHQIYLSSH
ncbi:unnamed protein product [Lepeophtheirus salmonis]|uniref:(salmon louse) hypothetical protein n=1 Tax=Lepeophtheirus salmonis TaxID=72036 RepID=A0A7R8CCU6_LEPSM|nr:unnamed protein product [Lepeophtheirus salmonis]CAF2769540.1 unnamed protein product [Lepeophtheirus salmonis]